MSELPRALLVDLDDTILAYTAAGSTMWRTVCDEFAVDLAGVDAAALLGAVEAQAQWFWSDPERHRTGRHDLFAARRAIVRAAFERLGSGDRATADRLADAFTVRREDALTPFPGALETLAELRRRGVRLALITNGSAAFQRRKIERFGLEPLFDALCIEGELGFGKPDRRVFDTALSRLGATTTETWCAGDNLEWDIAPAVALGMTAIWVDHAAKGLPAETPVRPTRTITSLTELIG